MHPIIYVLIVLAQAAMFGSLAYNLADEKGYYPRSYFWLGFFLGVFGFLYTVGLPISLGRREKDAKYLAYSISELEKKSANE